MTGGFEAEAGVGAGYDDGFAGVGVGWVGEGGEELALEEVKVALRVEEAVSGEFVGGR